MWAHGIAQISVSAALSKTPAYATMDTRTSASNGVPVYVPVFTAWRQRQIGMNNLSKVVARQQDNRGSNQWPLSHKTDAVATRLSRHPIAN